MRSAKEVKSARINRIAVAIDSIVAEVAVRVAEMVGEQSRVKLFDAKATGKPARGPDRGTKIKAMPCPVCGEPNKARRFSYRCANHRDAAKKVK